MASKAETQFKATFPNAWATQTKSRPYEMFTVYAGDYLCAEGHTRAEAFKTALQQYEWGFITPDPNERATKEAAHV